jgi:hypothetical protein
MARSLAYKVYLGLSLPATIDRIGFDRAFGRRKLTTYANKLAYRAELAMRRVECTKCADSFEAAIGTAVEDSSMPHGAVCRLRMAAMNVLAARPNNRGFDVPIRQGASTCRFS